MRIGMMADMYKPHISGVTNYIALNKRFLEAAGHEVFVFTFGNLPQGVEEDEANVIRSHGMPLVDTGYFFGLGYQPKAKALLQTMDIVHIHHPFLSGRLSLRYCKPVRIPIVFTNHTRYDLYLQAYLPILPEGLGETFIEAYLPSFCRSVDLVISPSAGVQAVLQRLGVDVSIEVIPNGVDLRPFQAKMEPRNRSEFGFGEEDVILVYAGRIAPEKNLAFLLRSFAGVASTFENVRLILIGTGPELTTLKSLARDMGLDSRVYFTGLVPYAEMPAYMAMCDAFVTASVTEVHPLSVIEAMAAGLPALGIDSPGISDTIQDNVTGLISTDDMAVFTARMVRLATDRTLRQQMGQAAMQASRQYAIERTVKLMMERYERVVDQAAPKKQGIQFFVRSKVEKWRK
jgi:1,2-diacylglycerol 3-alpha-glucosyltransferase